jgi:hypothetical protein
MKHADRFLVVSITVTAFVHRAAAEDWQWRRIAFEGIHLASVVSPPESSDVIYITVSEFGNPVDDRGVYKSVDSGQTWQYCGVSYVHGGPGAYPRRTRDAGIHWEEVAAPLGRIVTSPWQRGLLLGTGNAFGGWELYRSVDDGISWTMLSSYEAPFLSDNVVFGDSEQDLVFAGTYVLPAGPLALARSTDGGETWTPVLEGKICAFDQDSHRVGHWAAIRSNDSGNPGWFAETFDDGATWTEWELTDNIRYVWQMEFDVFDSQVLYLWGPKSGLESLGIYRSIYRATRGKTRGVAGSHQRRALALD